MAWNNGLERMKFEAEQKKLAAEYRAAGMSEAQIQQMYEFDLEVFNSNRRFAEHTQQFPESPLKMAMKDSLRSTRDFRRHSLSRWICLQIALATGGSKKSTIRSWQKQLVLCLRKI